jgi:hypothetical protein
LHAQTQIHTHFAKGTGELAHGTATGRNESVVLVQNVKRERERATSLCIFRV